MPQRCNSSEHQGRVAQSSLFSEGEWLFTLRISLSMNSVVIFSQPPLLLVRFRFPTT